MVIGNRQKIVQTGVHPFLAGYTATLGTMPVPARVVCINTMATGITGVRVISETTVPAMFCVVKDGMLLCGKFPGILLMKFSAVAFNDVGEIRTGISGIDSSAVRF